MTERRQFCPRGHDTFTVGRDSSYRCLQCKREDAAASRRAREAEINAARSVELRRRQAEEDRRREREHRRALQAGGDVAAEAKWRRLWDETLSSTSFGLCQWPLPNGHPGACTRRTRDVYCPHHERLVEQANEAFKRGGREAADAFYRSRGTDR